MATLTASSGTVNLTTPTGWSPAQIPQNGDDLIIGAATLDLDADLTLNTITFNNAASRLAFTGTNRTITATNGFFLTAHLGGNRLLQTTINSGTTFSSFGKWTFSGGSPATTDILFSCQGGVANFSTIGSDLSEILFEITSTTHRISLFGQTSGTINTNGILKLSNGTATATISINNGTWNHTSNGTNEILSSSSGVSIFTSSIITFYGDVDKYGDGRFIQIQPSSVFNFYGSLFLQAASNLVFNMQGGTVNLYGSLGSVSSNAATNPSGTGVFNWTNQTANILSGRLTFNTLIQITGLKLDNFGKLDFRGGVVADNATAISNRNINAVAYTTDNNLDNRILPFQTTAPTLPSVQNVSAGTIYGYTGFLQTGTGLILDPAILASAISANIPDIVDGVHEADTRDYDDIPGSIGFEFKKLRQANPFIEFEVTDDITPTDTEFAVLITDFHDDGSFQDSVLCFTEGDLTYDNNPILSLVKHTGYSVITLQRPMRVAPEVGDKGIINPLSHVYSIEETQDGLALEATSQSILTAIGEIDVDFAPVETLINVSTQTILAAIAEEDDPTNVVNLQIAIKDQNDIGVAGVYVSIHGTAKSTVTNINGVAELWVNPNTNYNLRFVVPPGYTPLPEENIVVGINDIEEVYVSPQIATPSIPEELCELRIYIKSQGTTEVGSLENIRVNAKLIDDYKIVNQNLFINIIDVAESDENGYVALVLLKDTDYVLSLTRENSIVIKRILIKTTNNAVQTLSEVVNA